MFKNSIELYKQALKLIPGGVNSPVRAFKNVGGTPLFIKKGKGAIITDEDNNNYIDYVTSWGPLILGHSNPKIQQAIEETLKNGISFGAPTKLETELATKIIQLMPNIEQIRMVNSGTEATMSAIRLSRGHTKKNKIIKFTNCYHGHSDNLLVKAGSGVLTFSLPDSAGIPATVIQDTITVPYNDLRALQFAFDTFKDNIACVILEPIVGNMNMILPKDGFLENIRSLCDKFNSVLIFDEVITGFRVALGGAQSLYNIKPDLTCLGKIIGAGLPVGAFGGKKEIMQCLAPCGSVYQAGTLSGNPLAMAAGLATLNELEKLAIHESGYQNLENMSVYLTTNLQKIAIKNNIKLEINHTGGLFGIKFTNDPEHELFKQFFHAMLKLGHYFAPSPFEAGFMSFSHTKSLLDKTLQAAESVFKQLHLTVGA